MKFIALLVFSAAVQGQVAPTPAQQPAADLTSLPADTVVATYSGKKLTAGELERMLSVLPPQNRRAALQDSRAFIQQYVMMLKLAEMAEKNELHKLSPTKEALEYNRSFILSSAQLSHISQTLQVPEGEHEKFYEANRDRYQQVQLKAIYIPFGSAKISGAKQNTEAEAKALAEKLVAKLRGGADFIAMVKEYSQDEDSKKKDGDFPVIRKSDNIPDAIRAVVFGMKKGDISAPVRQPNGFYIFRAEEVTARPLSQVKGEIDADLRDRHARAIVDGIVKSLDIKYENEGLSAAPRTPPSLRK